jgi:2-phosphoglycerate kinase
MTSSPRAAAFRSLPSVTFACITDDDQNQKHVKENSAKCIRYTKADLYQMLQALGCKPRRASKACAKVFLILQQRAALPETERYSLAPTLHRSLPGVCSVTLPRSDFETLVLESMQPQDPTTSLLDLRTAAALQERRTSVTILLCGTTGTGKSTLASLLAARLGITTVISTDSIRHLMRSFAHPDQEPLLWASTYQVAALNLHSNLKPQTAPLDPSKSAVDGYLIQAEAVMSHVDKLIAAAESRKESLVVEGVHLSPAFATQLMRKRSSVVPFLVHISNEAKHLERFAVRAKAMTLRPEGNRYVRHLRAIRDIQDHLCSAADTRAVPKIDNTNVDRSVATIHATVLGSLRRKSAGDALIDFKTGRCTALLEEYLGCKNATWSGSDMLELIRRKVAAGEAVSPTEGPSTSAASTSVAGGGGMGGGMTIVGGEKTPSKRLSLAENATSSSFNKVLLQKLDTGVSPEAGSQKKCVDPSSSSSFSLVAELNFREEQGLYEIVQRDYSSGGEEEEDQEDQEDGYNESNSSAAGGNGGDGGGTSHVLGSVLETDEGRSDVGDVWIHELNH